MWAADPNPSVRWVQLLLLVAVTAFVGAMWGLERTTVPLIAEQDFGIASVSKTLSFVAGFGLTKTFANLFAGGLMDRVGRRRVLVLGWAAGVPVPLLIIWAPTWEWIVGANLLLGVNQGLCWTATILMMMDILGEKRRGLSTGVNEFVGYGGVALLTFATGIIAAAFAPRPHVFLFGLAIAALGLVLSVLFVKETGHHARREAAANPGEAPSSFLNAFAAAARDKTMMSCNQAGLVTKVNDAAIWGLLPLALVSREIGLARIGIVASLYPLVWGVSQLGTGPLSDYVGRKPLIVLGMLLQAGGMWLLAAAENDLLAWVFGACVLGLGAAAVYPTLIAAVGDSAHPLRRASAIGIYRWYRDSGFIVGAIVAGVLADIMGFQAAFLAVGAMSLVSALAVGAWMDEPGWRSSAARGTSDGL